MKKVLLIVIALVSFSCKQETQQITKMGDKTPENQLTMVDYKTILENSQFAFDVTVDSSYFYRRQKNGFIYDRQLASSTHKEIDSVLKSLESKIISQNSFFLNNNDSSFNLRARLHEYNFHSNEIASATYKQMGQIALKNMDAFEQVISWDRPSRLILKDNHIYHIVTDGNHMDGIQLDLANLLFPKNSIPY